MRRSSLAGPLMAPDTRRPIIESFFRCLIFLLSQEWIEARKSNTSHPNLLDVAQSGCGKIESFMRMALNHIKLRFVGSMMIHNLHILSIIIIYLHNSEVRLGLYIFFHHFSNSKLLRSTSSAPLLVWSLWPHVERLHQGWARKSCDGPQRHKKGTRPTWYRHGTDMVQTCTDCNPISLISDGDGF